MANSYAVNASLDAAEGSLGNRSIAGGLRGNGNDARDGEQVSMWTGPTDAPVECVCGGGGSVLLVLKKHDVNVDIIVSGVG